MAEFIQGTCLSMCPEKERWIREKEGLLHRFEVDESAKGSRFPKADPTKTVKCFSRSAAGLVMTDSSQLRPASVLLSTVRYLFIKIATRTDVDWITVYDFIFDRLRSVRQDIAIQRIDISTNIQLLESIVRFLVYSSQRLCERSITEFNAKINGQHLTECITRLLLLYDDVDEIGSEEYSPRLDGDMNKLTLSDHHRQQMEASYILLNMGNPQVLTRALRLPPRLRRCTAVQLSMNISFAWYGRNYVQVCSLIPKLEPILVCAAMTGIQKLRKMALKIMSSAYNSKILTFPGLKLQTILLYKGIDKIEADCNLFGISFINHNILFQKGKFKDEVESAHPEMYYEHETLQNLLPHILLDSI